ncbi:MAG: hypothetical protein D3908_08775 [Candidatus Electrothrix sp. AUS4]|nr:hypothetical protein [Candidatus Electrothrix sp. AUS4]
MGSELSQSLIFSSKAAPLITECLKGNPRQIKRFLNAFVLRKELAKVAKLSSIKDDILVKLMILEYSHLKEFKNLFDWQQTQDGFPKKIDDWEKLIAKIDSGAEKLEDIEIDEQTWNTKSIKRWLAMEPQLSDVDLRDYFWIARDRLESTLSNTALISPVVRLAFGELLSDNTHNVGKAVDTVCSFKEDERVSLLDLLENHLKRHADQISVYNAYIELIRKDIPGSASSYVSALSKTPNESIPPAMAFDLVTVSKDKPALKPYFDKIKEQLTSTEKNTMVKKALEKALNNQTSER